MLAEAGITVRAGVVVVVWVAGALYNALHSRHNASHAPPERTRSRPGSTALTLWARFSLGTMWSAAPKVKDDHQLRTHGPYAVTRHPIYTGMLGMLLGATLLGGIGQWIVLFPVGLILFEVKIRLEEHLMLATFPEEYPGTADRCHSLSRVSSYCVDATRSARRPYLLLPRRS